MFIKFCLNALQKCALKVTKNKKLRRFSDPFSLFLLIRILFIINFFVSNLVSNIFYYFFKLSK